MEEHNSNTDNKGKEEKSFMRKVATLGLVIFNVVTDWEPVISLTLNIWKLIFGL